MFSDTDLDEIVDKKIANNEPYEEELLYLRNAHAIHEYLVKHLAGGVDNADFGPYEVPIDLIKRLVTRGKLSLRTRNSTRTRSSTKARGDLNPPSTL